MVTKLEFVAMHEAGHALAILLMPIRPHIDRAWVYQDADQWYGKTAMEPKVWHPLDPGGVYNFAKALGGPLAQLISYPRSSGPQVEDLLSKTGTLVEFARQNLHHNLGIATNWWNDLVDIKAAYLLNRSFTGRDHTMVENELRRAFADPHGKTALEQIADELVRTHQLVKQGLLAVPVGQIPSLTLPRSLRPI